jgi:DmsE family decaheme c-type cytochrome
MLAATGAMHAATGFVGKDACEICHLDLSSAFARNPHTHTVAAAECESCHGPGKAHVDAEGDTDTIKAFSQLTARQSTDVCLRCHAQTLSRANIRRSEHTLNGMACTACHSIHGSRPGTKLLVKAQRELCYQCHTSVRAQFEMPFKHRVNEGSMTCTDCHNPHGDSAPTWRMAAKPRMTAKAMGNEEPCLKCHSEKRGPFAFEHPAVRVDGCEGCHEPHGSPNARLLKRPVVFTLCLECHNGAVGFGRTGAGVPAQTALHNMADPRFHNCTSCHVKIHGSNADATFLR